MEYTPEYKNTLINFDLKSFLQEYSKNDIPKIRKLYPELHRLLAEQIKIYPKAFKKLPSFALKQCFFTKKGFEQSTSEAVAEYKASLFGGNVLLDLSGGLGIDDAAFSHSFSMVISVDNDEELNFLVRINFEKCALANVERIDASAEEFIKKPVKADLVYLDPDRRSGLKRSVTLNESMPRIPDILERIFEISESVLLKLSPLIDLTYLRRNLSQISRIYVISLENEVKEVLVLIKKSFAGLPEVSAVDLTGSDVPRVFRTTINSTIHVEYSSEGGFLYEPSVSIVKAGLIDEYTVRKGLKRIGKVSPYLVSNEAVREFMGRVFSILCISDFSKSGFRKYIKESSIHKANISRRDFPLTVDQIKKQYGITDGGDEYMFFTTNAEGEKMFIHCRKLTG